MSERTTALLLCLAYGIAMLSFVTFILTRAGNLLSDVPNASGANTERAPAFDFSYDVKKGIARLVAMHPFVAVFALAVLPSLVFFAIYTFSPPDYAKWTMTGQLGEFPSPPDPHARATVRINGEAIKLDEQGKFSYEFFVRRDDKDPNGGTFSFKRDGYCSVIVRAIHDTDGNVQVKGTHMTATKKYNWTAATPEACPYD